MTKRIIQSAWLWILLSTTVTAGTARVVEVEAEHVLGTHLQVLVSSPSLSEAGVRASALAEVERLSAIFNTRDPRQRGGPGRAGVRPSGGHSRTGGGARPRPAPRP
jgi:hypothetical protein